jgi:hypothetical protein
MGIEGEATFEKEEREKIEQGMLFSKTLVGAYQMLGQ